MGLGTKIPQPIPSGAGDHRRGERRRLRMLVRSPATAAAGAVLGRDADGSASHLHGYHGSLDVLQVAFKRRAGHRDGVQAVGLAEVVVDEGAEGGVAVELEFALDEECAPVAVRGVVGHAHAFCPAQPVVGCRFGELPRTGRPVFLDGRQVLVLSFSLRSLVLLSARSGVVVGEGEVPVVP